jgi:fatty-acyl-CoA synthase
MTAAARLSYEQGTSDVPLRGETIGQMWDAAVAAHERRDALVSPQQGIRWTYAEMHEEVERCAR